MTDPIHRSRRRWRVWAIVAAVFVLTGLLACVSLQPGKSGVVVDAAGNPVADARVLVVHWGEDHRSLACGGSYICGGRLLRTDAAGRYEFGSRLLFTSPLVSGLRPMVVAAYSPDRRSGVHDPQWDTFDVRLPATADAAGWLACLDGLRMRGDWFDLDAASRAELHELMLGEYRRFLSAHGDQDRPDGLPWRMVAQPYVDHLASHRPAK